jgi:hypothetical protein
MVSMEREQECRGRVLTEAGLVPASDQDPPLDGRGGIGGDGLVEGVLPVVNGEDRQLLLAQLGLHGGNGVMDAGTGDVRAELVQDILELGLVLLEEVLLGSGEDGQGRDEG